MIKIYLTYLYKDSKCTFGVLCDNLLLCDCIMTFGSSDCSVRISKAPEYELVEKCCNTRTMNCQKIEGVAEKLSNNNTVYYYMRIIVDSVIKEYFYRIMFIKCILKQFKYIIIKTNKFLKRSRNVILQIKWIIIVTTFSKSSIHLVIYQRYKNTQLL